ncbi:putative aldehyde dehydrogenase [Gordonia alkanivorans NBRC 16433]|uniref:Putative aldehyde dehydrogenase n=1 Tax=Gordonia alkanivorans NBRC 16433 TaxID=1027371 RepID=F9VQ76_9ACTN|nr:putative aldehyde dehydrogenase [Gordonia alkanivorans NBRC 16433]
MEAGRHRSAARVPFGEALTEAGLPAGVVNLTFGDREIGDAIVHHTGIDAITFTGSTGVGRGIAAAGAARGVPVQAEMGGKNAAIVLGDADLDLAVQQILLGASSVIPWTPPPRWVR